MTYRQSAWLSNIADGTVVYKREPTKIPNPEQPDHPLNYRGAWTSDGCVVIKHTTEIGANAAGQATEVTFYSITMHLHAIRPQVRVGNTIYRKDPIGQAGYIYGEANKIHFEIICDDNALQKFIDRASGDLATSANGRTDAVYGDLYFRLPEWTNIYLAKPAANALQPDIPAMHTTREVLFVGLRYAGGAGEAAQRGDAYLSTYRADGSCIGTPLPEHESEYNHPHRRLQKFNTPSMLF